MKTIDFTKPGGFPLTQDRLAYLQTAYSEIFGALGSAPGLGAPIILSGMDETTTGFMTTVTDGYFFYNGEVIRFQGSTFGLFTFPNVAYIRIAPVTAPLTYNDGSINNVVYDKVGSIAGLASSTPDNPTAVKFSNVLSFGKAIGLTYREQIWQHIAVTTAAGSGSILGDIYYKKDTVANTLQLRGSLNTFTPADFSAWPNVSSLLMGSVSVGYHPANEVYFTAQVEAGTTMIKDANGTYFSRLNAVLKTDGKIYVDWIQPQAGIFTYSMFFNLVLPLD